MRNPPLHRYATRPGLYFTDDGGADVVVRSETAGQVWLCVLESIDQPSAFFQDAIRLFSDPGTSFIQQIHEFPVCTRIIEHLYLRETLFRMDGPNYGLWYVHLPKAWDGMRYGYRVDGAWDPKHGVRFNPYKFLLDPYGKGVEGAMELDPATFSYACEVKDRKVIGSAYGEMSTVDSLGHVPVSVAIDDRDVHKHEGDPDHPHVPWRKTVIYEMHVKGFTANAPWLPEELRGTYAGLAHPITLAYLQNLGVTSIELLPIQAKQDELFLQEHGRKNYWGYSTLSYFSPEPTYATKAAQEKGATAVRQEVIDMVRALHEAGFEVIMDVVYNHTCEGGVEGPTICWRGLDDLAYYRHQKSNAGRLEDTTGCGNTFDFTNTHVVTFAVDSLRYWAKRIGIDGFRFDLGVTLARLNGEFTQHHPFLYALRSDLLLGNLKLIMEPWDLGNLGWRTGQFGIPFAEWNDRFRDTARTFWLQDVDGSSDFGRTQMQEMATRLCGSADLYATDPGRGATASINFVTCHDGFTLTDLTRYNSKHNEANGEHNNDGSSVNHSANFGVEGVTKEPEIIAAREQAAMNLTGMLLLSLGTPMMLAGDEFRNTQDGNNNAYCQDNDITWMNWDWLYSPHKTREMRRLETVSRLVALRKSLDLYHHEDFFTRLTQLGLLKPSDRVKWFLPNGQAPIERDWFDLSTRSFTMRLLSNSEVDVCIVVNGVAEDRQFHLPADSKWMPKWCSAEVNGRWPGHGDHVESGDAAEDISVWMQHVQNANETVRRLAEQARETAAAGDGVGIAGAFGDAISGPVEGAATAAAPGTDASDADNVRTAEFRAVRSSRTAAGSGSASGVSTGAAADADSVQSAEDTQLLRMTAALEMVGNAAAAAVHDDAEPSAAADASGESADKPAPLDDNVWTMPALSITLMKQIQL
ncbi:glycogen debranching protein GlgX [Bifidobacterium callitrichidarum]|uniref:Glycogen debranching enzyme GlgX n=1 Tax=Bifidobacterium callitrichidarum TaxID=2052941 RepID=A0A2U2N6C0_9BIFI|nr:glycogen debranching protein GlgX [Bifidobacterium callitrichidarum]PWG64499.1 glycogen debranching enzyme GlgX [Bifidobacterium callitrichidarum]